uniref:Uncharacterized protein n=1 Tax=Octopus bimaculoides TaxID=37653 RepID=A0A0L8G1Q0_OCTBM
MLSYDNKTKETSSSPRWALMLTTAGQIIALSPHTWELPFIKNQECNINYHLIENIHLTTPGP